MWLLHKNFAVTTKLSNPASIVLKCPKDTSAPVQKCRDTSDMPKCPRSDFWKVWSVLGPKCLYTEGSVPHPINFFLIFELKKASFGAFWVLFLQLHWQRFPTLLH